MIEQTPEFLQKQEAFKIFYNQNLRNDFVQLEAIRTGYLQRFWRRMIGLILLISSVIYIWIRSHSFDDIGIIIFVSVIILFFGLKFVFEVANEYAQKAKNTVMDKILSFWGDMHLNKNNKINISDGEIRKSNLLDVYNDRKSSDNLFGQYEGLSISISEELMRHISQNRKSRSVKTIFQGVLVIFNRIEKMKDILLVREKLSFISKIKQGKMDGFLIFMCLLIIFIVNRAIHYNGNWEQYVIDMIQDKRFVQKMVFEYIFPILLTIILGARYNKKFKKVKLESLTFDKMWHVEASDQIEARCILTPVFMEKMLDIKRQFNGQHIDFSMYEDKVMIAIHSRKDMFEVVSLFKSALLYSTIWDIVSQFYCIFSLVDFLNMEDKKC